MSHQVLARKYRPKQFSEVVGQPHIVQALSNALNHQILHSAYLFTGTRGVGKTTFARIMAKCLNCEKGISATPCGQCANCQAIDNGRFPDLFEVDAASRTKVEDTRELLDNVQYAPSIGRYKVYLIDEVHMLSGHSFNALLKTLEEPPPHVIFLLATTDHQKLPATVLSRCLQFHLQQIPAQQIAEHIQQVLQQENIPFETEATELLSRAANGSMRDALSLLDQGIAYGNSKILIADIKAMLGTIEPNALYDLLHALQDKDGNALLAAINKLAIQGTDFSQALADLLLLLHQVAVLQIIPNASADNASDKLRQLSHSLAPQDVQLFYQIGLIGQRDLAYAPSPQSGFEMILLRMLAFYPQQELQSFTTNATKTNSIAMPVKTNQPTTSKTTAKVATINPNQISKWETILPQLNLTGAALALAQQCTLHEITQSTLYLSLSAKQKPLLNPRLVERINQAVKQQVNTDMHVKIDIREHQKATPAELNKHQQQQQQDKAKESIMQDKNIQQIIKTFDAEVIENSINPSNRNQQEL